METCFAPAPKMKRNEFRNQVAIINHSPLMRVLLKVSSGLLVVLNDNCQIVGFNHTFFESLGISEAEQALGLRLGESLKCMHAESGPGGCGTSEHCTTCGIVTSLMTAIQENRSGQYNCALTSKANGTTHDLCLQVCAHPLELEGHRWVVMCARDITEYQSMANLESVVLHDFSNIISSLLGSCNVLHRQIPTNEEVGKIHRAASRLGDEVSLQQELFHDSTVGYLPRSTPVSLADIRAEIELTLHGHKAADGKIIEENIHGEECTVHTDPLLVSRILGNMLLNALEATEAGGEIRFCATAEQEHVVWEVWNSGYIPGKVQKRIFQRHFSTKSDIGRGLGTFSMKLFGERYLGGAVDFSSAKEQGTMFRFRLPRS